MPIPGLNEDRCRARNRHAARHYGAVSAPVRLFRAYVEGAPATPAAEGTLPESETEALQRINALLPSGAEPLTVEEVWVHYCEAANGSFIPDRYLFLAESTLRNIARGAAEGVAFMNSHRTGGMSHPSELPFGKTFCGRFETYRDPSGTPRQRALIGFYMLRGVHPNGAGGPSTDDMHRMIEGGTVFDVSVGLYGGTELCCVCGGEVDAWLEDDSDYGCPHLPGTAYAMSEADRERMRSRGVPDGKCASELEDARLGENSAVYDGAVTGAGFRYQAAATAPLFSGAVHGTAFRKARAFARGGRLDPAACREAGSAFAALAKPSDFAGLAGASPRTLGVQELPATASGGVMGSSIDVPEGILRAFLEEHLQGSPEALAEFWARFDALHPADAGADTTTPRTGRSFDDQISALRTEVADCTARARDLASLRGQQGKALPLSRERHADLTALHTDLGSLLAATQPGPSEADLRERACRARAAAVRRAAPVGS